MVINLSNIVRLGFYNTPTHAEVSVTTASGTVLTADETTLYILLQNHSDAFIYLKLGAAAEVDKGICLSPKSATQSGGAYEMSKELGNLYTGALNAIHGSTGNKTLLVTKGV